MCSLHTSISNKSQGRPPLKLHKGRAHPSSTDDSCEVVRQSCLLLEGKWAILLNLAFFRRTRWPFSENLFQLLCGAFHLWVTSRCFFARATDNNSVIYTYVKNKIKKSSLYVLLFLSSKPVFGSFILSHSLSNLCLCFRISWRFFRLVYCSFFVLSQVKRNVKKQHGSEST